MKKSTKRLHTHKPKAKRSKKSAKLKEATPLEALLATPQVDKKINYERVYKGEKQVKYYISNYNPCVGRNTMQFVWFTNTLGN